MKAKEGNEELRGGSAGKELSVHFNLEDILYSRWVMAGGQAPEGEVIHTAREPCSGQAYLHAAQHQTQTCPVLVILERRLDSYSASGEGYLWCETFYFENGDFTFIIQDNTKL